MAEFTKLSAVEAVETVSETANVLIEEDGVIKRTPKDEISGGIKVASAAKVGQTIVVKAVDDAGNPTEWECADNVASWNDLDDKPFYEEAGVTTILPETTLEFTATGYSGQQKIENAEYKLIDGETYVVTWDEVEYVCIADQYSGVAVGDNSMLAGNTTQNFNADAPFLIWNVGSVIAKEAGTHTFKIEKADVTVKQIDSKFIPEWDAVIDIGNAPINYVDTTTSTVFISGDFSTIKAKLDKKKMPKISLINTGNYMDEIMMAHTPCSVRLRTTTDENDVTKYVIDMIILMLPEATSTINALKLSVDQDNNFMQKEWCQFCS